MSGKEAEGGNGSQIQRLKRGDIAFIEGLGVLGEDDIAVVGGGCRNDARARAPEIFFFLFGGAIGLQQIGGAFDAEFAVGVASGLLMGIKALGNVLTRVVFSYPGVDMLDIDGNGFAESWNFGLQDGNGGMQEVAEKVVVKMLLFAPKMTVTRNGALDIKSVGQGWIKERMEAKFKDQ